MATLTSEADIASGFAVSGFAPERLDLGDGFCGEALLPEKIEERRQFFEGALALVDDPAF